MLSQVPVLVVESDSMTNILMILIPVFMLAALVVVILGVLNMARQGKLGRERSNKLMQYRVLFQFIAIALIGLLFMLALD